jgi:hypothetical protein
MSIFSDWKKRRFEKQEITKFIFQIVADGRPHQSQLDELRQRIEESKMSLQDFGSVPAQAYKVAARAILARNTFTSEEKDSLDRFETALMVPEEKIESAKQLLARRSFLMAIANGHLPTVSVPGVILQRYEFAHWREDGDLLEERVVDRRYEGRSHGMSFRIAKGVSYRVGAQRGHIVVDRATIPISSGPLVITNQRLIFAGDRKSFALKLQKILQINCFGNGIKVDGDTGKSHLIQFRNPDNVDVVLAVLSSVINA